MKSKLINISQGKKIISILKKKKKKVILSHGVFDVLHIGHINHFISAKKNGDVLIVSVTPDKYVNKGPNRPIFNIKQRISFLSNISSIDYVIENKFPTSEKLIKILKPNIYCKGLDYLHSKNDVTGEIKNEIKAIKKIGGKIIFTKDKLFSSSKIINDVGINLNDEQKKYLDFIKSTNNTEKKQITDIFDNLRDLKILVIGECIIDEYVTCEALGKSGKDSNLAVRKLNSEKYPGGTAAIVKNIGEFCKKITLLSYLGENYENKNFFYKNLQKKNINLKFINKSNSPTIKKTRFIDSINHNKILGLQELNDKLLEKKQETSIINFLKKEIQKHDVVIVSDYGHGLITDKIAKIIISRSKFLAINAQLNAANLGFHTISKYNKSDLIIINESELRHEMRDKEGNIKNLILQLKQKINAKYFVVTSGSDGCHLYDQRNSKFIKCPAFATKVKDKIGAGDTMLSILSLTIFKKINLKLGLLISSLAAAMNIENYANSSSLSKIKLIKTINSYLS